MSSYKDKHGNTIEVQINPNSTSDLFTTTNLKQHFQETLILRINGELVDKETIDKFIDNVIKIHEKGFKWMRGDFILSQEASDIFNRRKQSHDKMLKALRVSIGLVGNRD